MASATRMVLMHLPKNNPIDITFSNINYTVDVGFMKNEQKQVLKGISGRFNSGELTAIMGPSGAGKSTLLNILTGFQRKGMVGDITMSQNRDEEDLINDEFSQKNVCITKYQKQSCYIMQDDQLCPLFTVLEIMMMAADLKLGYTLSYKSKLLVIEDILDSIGLSGCIHTRCGRLSGGQKKRLSIALELIDNPPIMFLDEPTTGLDSTSSQQCISILKGLAKGGRTVVCTIHQPSASTYEMFDHVYIMAEGYCVYQGSSRNTIPYLQTIGLNCPQYHNPADFVLEVVTGEYGHFTPQLKIAATNNSWRTPPQIADPTRVLTKRKSKNSGLTSLVLINQPSEFNKFLILIHRSLMQIYRDWTVTHIKICMHFLVGVLLGLLFENAGIDGGKAFNNIGFFIVTLVYLSYTSIMPAILKFPAELHVLKKELFNNWYKLPTFFGAFLVTNMPLQMLYCGIYTSISYYLTGQVMTMTRFSMFLIICQLMTLISESIGLILGTAMNPVNGVFIGAIITCLCILFAGFLVLFNHMPLYLYYFSYMSYMRYALEGLVVSMYGYGREPLECLNKEYCHYRFPETIFKEIGMSDGKYCSNLSVMVGFLFLFVLISFLTLQRRLRSQ